MITRISLTRALCLLGLAALTGTSITAEAQKLGGSGAARCEAVLPLKALNAALKAEFEYKDTIIPRTGLADETSCKWLWARGTDMVSIELYWMGKNAAVAYSKKVSPPPHPKNTAELFEYQVKWRESVGRDKRRTIEGVGDRAALVSGVMRREIGYVQIGDGLIEFESSELTGAQAESALGALSLARARP